MEVDVDVEVELLRDVEVDVEVELLELLREVEGEGGRVHVTFGPVFITMEYI